MLSFKKPVFWVVILAVLAAAATIVALASNPLVKAEPGPADKYLAYKTDYIGDNSKVGGIVSLMSFPEGVTVDRFELQTASEPYGVAIYLNADSKPSQNLAQDIENLIYARNAAVLFALVDNADSVGFWLNVDPITARGLSYSRQDIDALYGTDVRTFAESDDAFMKLLDGPDASVYQAGGAGTPVEPSAARPQRRRGSRLTRMASSSRII